jgi:tRNA synthetases class I (E and Q), catalytic domain
MIDRTHHTTRIAPSPTGMFHLGNARTALFNWLAARATATLAAWTWTNQYVIFAQLRLRHLGQPQNAHLIILIDNE